MLPRWHVFWGAILTLALWLFFPKISGFYLILIFLSSVFIDIDHYFCAILKTGKWPLSHAFDYHMKLARKQKSDRDKGIREKGDFHIFHTIEFHLVIIILSLFYKPFFFIFVGMMFHSLLDLGYIIYEDYFYRREYLLVRWLRKSSDKTNKSLS